MRSLSAARAFVAVPIALVVALTPLMAMAAPGEAQTTDSANRIDAYMRGRMPDLRTPGLSVVVVDSDQVIFSRGYGFADREAGTPMTQDTLVQIASTNKGMIALALMQLVEQGVVDLDAPVTRYLPTFSMDDERAADITVRQVLSHTSGIPASGAWDSVRDDQGLAREVAALAASKLRFAPGTGYEYASSPPVVRPATAPATRSPPPATGSHGASSRRSRFSSARTWSALLVDDEPALRGLGQRAGSVRGRSRSLCSG